QGTKNAQGSYGQWDAQDSPLVLPVFALNSCDETIRVN
ncbi:MAG: hypothetical protein ACI9WC_002802, partial [Arenicella sp.]